MEQCDTCDFTQFPPWINKVLLILILKLILNMILILILILILIPFNQTITHCSSRSSTWDMGDVIQLKYSSIEFSFTIQWFALRSRSVMLLLTLDCFILRCFRVVYIQVFTLLSLYDECLVFSSVFSSLSTILTSIRSLQKKLPAAQTDPLRAPVHICVVSVASELLNL